MTTAYVWDGAHIIAEYTNGSLTKKYIYGPGIDRPVAMVNVSGQTETWYYYYADALGSIRLMSDAGGAIVESYAYDVYGWPRVMTSAGADGNWLIEDVSPYNFVSAIGNPYMFTARRWDHHTFLYYYRFRDYSPDLGRFLQTDPAGYIDGMNLYAYVNNNPLNWIDPWGLNKECPDKTGWWQNLKNFVKGLWEAKGNVLPPGVNEGVEVIKVGPDLGKSIIGQHKKNAEINDALDLAEGAGLGGDGSRLGTVYEIDPDTGRPRRKSP